MRDDTLEAGRPRDDDGSDHHAAVEAALAALSGILARMTFDRLVADPAPSSGAFVITTCAVAGFFTFLSRATHFLL